MLGSPPGRDFDRSEATTLHCLRRDARQQPTACQPLTLQPTNAVAGPEPALAANGSFPDHDVVRD